MKGGRAGGGRGRGRWASTFEAARSLPLLGPCQPSVLLLPAACMFHAHAGVPRITSAKQRSMCAAQGPPHRSAPALAKCNTVPTHSPSLPACLSASLPAEHMHFLHRLVNGVHNSDQGIDLHALKKCLSCANNLYDHMIQ